MKNYPKTKKRVNKSPKKELPSTPEVTVVVSVKNIKFGNKPLVKPEIITIH